MSTPLPTQTLSPAAAIEITSLAKSCEVSWEMEEIELEPDDNGWRRFRPGRTFAVLRCEMPEGTQPMLPVARSV